MKRAIVGLGLIGALATLAVPYATEKYQDRRDTTAAKTALTNAIAAASFEVGYFLEAAAEHPEKTVELYEDHEGRMRPLMSSVAMTDAALSARDLDIRKKFWPLLRELQAVRGCVDNVMKLLPDGKGRWAALRGVLQGHMQSNAAIATRVQKVFEGEDVGWYGFGDCTPPPWARGQR